MAAPNLQSPLTITGKQVATNLSSTTEVTLVTNAASSGKLLRVRSITVANTSTAGSSDVTVRFYSAASAGTAYPIGAVTIPVGAAAIIIGSENPQNIEEDRRITVQASAANYITAIASYEEVA